MPALDAVAQAGLQQGFGFELIVDDQDFTHEILREGRVLGCLRYVAVASTGFIQQAMPQGLNRGNFAKLPWLVFHRKDGKHAVWVGQAFGLNGPRLVARHVPSTEAHAPAAVQGWGIAVMPEQLAAPALASGALQALPAEVFVDVLLHWHQWKLRPGTEPDLTATATATPDAPLRAGALDQVGRALAEGARSSLRPPP